jgi:hypothetical protein
MLPVVVPIDPLGTVQGRLDEVAFAQASASKEILMEGDGAEKTIELALNAGEYASGMVLAVLNDTGTEVACREGCSYCCHLMTEVFAPEVLAIARYVVERFTPEERDRLTRDIDAFIAATDGMTAARRMDVSIPCPLLADGRCSAYEVRPMACRAWHSKNAEGCRLAFEEPAARHKTPLNGLAFLVGNAVKHGLTVALQSRRLDGRSLELVRGLKIALDDPSLLATWRDRPHAFGAAVKATVHPDPDMDRLVQKSDREVYRRITNRPEWNEIHPATPQ